MPSLHGAAAVLLDLDGVLYVEDEPVPGARAAVDALRARGLVVRFVTNTTSRPRRLILERLAELGFRAERHELATPASLAVRRCREAGHRRAVLVMNDAVKEDFADLTDVEEDAEAVIVGDVGDALSLALLNRAFRSVMDGAELIALQKNRYWLTRDGLSLDVGAFVAALEYGTRREAQLIGKPARTFFEAILAEAQVDAAQAVMVGDDVESDIGGAQRAGLAGILVRTGKYREDAVRASGVEPSLVLDSVAELPDALAP